LSHPEAGGVGECPATGRGALWEWGVHQSSECCGARGPEVAAYALRPLDGLKVCVTGLNREDRDRIKALCGDHGGQYTPGLGAPALKVRRPHCGPHRCGEGEILFFLRPSDPRKESFDPYMLMCLIKGHSSSFIDNVRGVCQAISP